MLTIRDKSTTPKEKWRYPAVDGSEIITNSWMNLKIEVRQHYAANGQPVPDEQTIIDWLCKNVSVNCFDNGQEVRNLYTDPPPGKGIKRHTSWGVFSPLKLLLKEGDRGLGDVVERTIGPVGGDAFKKWYKKLTGESCNCKERQEDWNYMYPA